MSTGSVLPGVLVGLARGEEARGGGPGDDRGVVAVGREHAGGAPVLRVADHRERRARHRHAVDAPVGIEDLVPAMLAVRLREHHHLDVGRVAAEAPEDIGEVGDLSVRQREALRRIRRARAPPPDPRRARRGRALRADASRTGAAPAPASSISVSVIGSKSGAASAASASGVERRARVDAPGLAALDAPHGREPADTRDVGRLRRPGRHRPEAAAP